MNLTAIDIETNEISYENPIPDVICMSYAHTEDCGIRLADDTLGVGVRQLLDGNNPIVGHNIAFDLSLLCFQYPELWKPVFKAYVEDRVYDTLMRERLLMLTTNGDFNVLYEGHNCTKIPGYSLADLEQKYLDVEDRHEMKNNPDSPRFHYGKLAGIPVSEWPTEAKTYSLADSVNCLGVYDAQEVLRKNVISEIGIDPFAVEHYKVRHAFSLRLLECRGERVDPEMIKKITKEYRDEYNAVDLVEPLVKAGLLILGQPAMPFARGTKEHITQCIHHKEHPDYKVGRKQNCECPPKMKKATDDKTSSKELHKYIWGLAFQTNNEIEAWPSDKSDFKRQCDGQKFSNEFIQASNGVMPGGVTLQADETWQTMFADKDPVLQKWAERKKLAKIVTDYLPKLHQENGEPAEYLRCSFFPLKKTGRSSSRAPSFYPGRNGQNVDPRVRPCTIPHNDGDLIISSDFSVMELATLAQKCINLFDKSILADKINRGDDVHAYLAAQIAVHMDSGFAGALGIVGVDTEDHDAVFNAFMKCKGSNLRCLCTYSTDAIKLQHKAKHGEEHNEVVTWGEFYTFYRTFAKPVGLGYPGGLGPATMVAFAKGTYKVDLTEDLARQLRQIWLDTLPEMGQYLTWIKNHCRDPQHSAIYEKHEGQKKLRQFYCYDTPHGMHRARADFCACANGAGLQAFAAEGALDALFNVQRRIWTIAQNDNDVMYECFPINFVHDEIIWECPDDCHVDLRVSIIDKIMVDAMELITPDVKARTNSTAMRRWYKEAEPTYDETGALIPWELE